MNIEIFEYLKDFGGSNKTLNDLYLKHKLFFLDEIREYVNKKYQISSSEEIFYGFSNGDFGYEILINNCHEFDYYFLFIR